MTDDAGDLRMDLTLRPFDSGEVILRQVALGMSPLVLIEPEMDGDDVIFKVDATGIEQDELAQVLDMIARALRDDIQDEPA